MSHVDDAKELGFEQLALRIVRDFNRFAVPLRFTASPP
jgi:hypothetical protein